MKPVWQQRAGYLFIAILIIPLSIHAFNGIFCRLIADDYCSTVIAKAEGILGGTINWYWTWSGRFSANFLDSLIGFLSPAIIPFSTLIVIIVWFFASAMTIHQFPLTASRPAKTTIAVLGAALMIFCTLEITPLVTQSLYWGQGMHSVIPPLVLVTVYIGLAQYRRKSSLPLRRSALWLLASGIVTFLAGGFSETFVVFQTCALTVAILSGLLFDIEHFKKSLLAFLVAGLLGSIMALLTVMLAPGNQYRQEYYPPPPGLEELLKISLNSTGNYLKDIFISKRHLLTMAGLLSLCGMLGAGFLTDQEARKRVEKRAWILLWLPLTGLVLQFACFVPSAYGMSSPPPDRTMIIPVFVLVCTSAAWGYLVGQLIFNLALPQNAKRITSIWILATGLTMFFLVVSIAWNSYKLMEIQSTLREYASDWDRTDQLIRSARSEGQGKITIEKIRNGIGLEDIGPDSNTWVNQCVSDYYDIPVMTEE